MPDRDKRFLREILDEGFYKIDRDLFEIAMQVDKVADRDMIRVDRVDQVKLRQAELLEIIEELAERVETLEKSLQNSRIIIRHGVSVIICVAIIITWLYWAGGG